MKRVKENWALLLLGGCMCVCSIAVIWMAPYLNWIDSYRCTLSISGGTVWVDASVIASVGSSESCIHVYLQRREGVKWVDAAGWTESREGNRAAVSASVPAVPGETYRIWMQAGAVRNGFFQCEDVISPSKTA